MKSTKERAIARMAELGVKMSDDGSYDAPNGFKMASCGLHYAVFTDWQGVLEDLEQGLVRCEPECCPAFHG